HDYIQSHPRRSPSVRSAAETKHAIVVTDDWPEQVPIGDAELRVIEGHLRKELDDMFALLP
ncbi:MAG: hypothetical protein ACRD68_12495, partial [Pyrinomonadaceae bacterium]